MVELGLQLGIDQLLGRGLLYNRSHGILFATGYYAPQTQESTALPRYIAVKKGGKWQNERMWR